MERNLRKILGDTVGILTAQNGQETARAIKQRYPTTNVIICTAHKDFAYKAWDLFISGYLLKPFAYLVDPELKKASIRKYVMELRRTFSALGLDDVLCHTRDNYYVNTARLDCDLYRFLDGDASARKLYVGEYMSQYSWAESTIGYIENHFQ